MSSEPQPPETHLDITDLADQPVAVQATISPNGMPHLVPITFVVTGPSKLLWAIDHKPKRTSALRRWENLQADPRGTVLLHHYSSDWSELWWVRLDGIFQPLSKPTEIERAYSLLAEKYQQYQDNKPQGPYLQMQVHKRVGWSAATPKG